MNSRTQRLARVLADPKSERWLIWLRFGGAGLLNAVFGYGVFAALLFAGVASGPALIAATLAGVLFNFQTSRRLVFRNKGQFVRFVGVYLCILVVNWLALRGFVSLGMSAFAGQALLTLPVAVLSFIGQRVFVFPATASGP